MQEIGTRADHLDTQVLNVLKSHPAAATQPKGSEDARVEYLESANKSEQKEQSS